MKLKLEEASKVHSVVKKEVMIGQGSLMSREGAASLMNEEGAIAKPLAH
jgi:hypothetical protein